MGTTVAVACFTANALTFKLPEAIRLWPLKLV